MHITYPVNIQLKSLDASKRWYHLKISLIPSEYTTRTVFFILLFIYIYSLESG
jgi:hypothetical protein